MKNIYQSDAVITNSISTHEFKGNTHAITQMTLLNLNTKTKNFLGQEAIIEQL